MNFNDDSIYIYIKSLNAMKTTNLNSSEIQYAKSQFREFVSVGCECRRRVTVECRVMD